MLFPASPQAPLREFWALLQLTMIIAGLMLPFDIIGGLVIPNAFESRRTRLAEWVPQWGRSVSIQMVFYSVTLFCYLQIGRGVGSPWLVVIFLAVQIGLLAGQELVWRLMTANVVTDTDERSVSYVSAVDPRFVGGVTGLPGFESIVLPNAWRKTLSTDVLSTVRRRREVALSTGARSCGIVTAMFWNTGFFGLALVAHGASVVSVADIVSVFLYFLLFSFTGLLLLPAFNRRGVFLLDGHVAAESDASSLCDAIAKVDEMTEQDASRSTVAESVFQPIPCPTRRVAALHQRPGRGTGAWNVARTTLFLSWAFGGPLSRAVHCNVGRPELWAILPTD
ncbi:MAG: hypothetical protein ACK58L_03170 [Planctomycetota bacterium]